MDVKWNLFVKVNMNEERGDIDTDKTLKLVCFYVDSSCGTYISALFYFSVSSHVGGYTKCRFFFFFGPVFPVLAVIIVYRTAGSANILGSSTSSTSSLVN